MKKILFFVLLIWFFSPHVFSQGTWITFPNIIPGNPFDVFFATEDVGYVACTNHEIYKTIDGGMNWTDVSPPFQYTSPGTWYNMFVLSEDTLFAASTSDNYLVRTVDGGINWDSIPFLGVGSVNSITFVNSSVGITHGGYPYKTIDGGLTWNQVSTQSLLYEMYFITDSIAIANGISGNVFISLDQGDTWTEYVGVLSDQVDGFYFFDDNHGIASGDNGMIGITFDQGLTWNSTSINAYQLRAIHFVNDTLGFTITGQQGNFFYQSNDAGLSWISVATLNCSGLTDLHFPSSCVGYIVGLNGYLIKYVDSTCSKSTTIKEEYDPLQIKIYPNPATHSIKLELPTNKKYQASILEINGALIQTWDVKNDAIIEVDFLPSGTYIIFIEHEGVIAQKKLFIKK